MGMTPAGAKLAEAHTRLHALSQPHPNSYLQTSKAHSPDKNSKLKLYKSQSKMLPSLQPSRPTITPVGYLPQSRNPPASFVYTRANCLPTDSCPEATNNPSAHTKKIQPSCLSSSLFYGAVSEVAWNRNGRSSGVEPCCDGIRL